MTSPETLLIRADGSSSLGTGHIMRMLALAQAWRRQGGKSIFARTETTVALEQRIAAEQFEQVRITTQTGSSEDAVQTLALAREHHAAWVVTDGYHFGVGYQTVLKEGGCRLLFVDDYGHAQDYCADLILNQNLGAEPVLYARRATHTRLLLGPRYVLLREEFLRWNDWPRQIPPIARKVLVTLGGSDPENVTGKVVEALHGLEVEGKVVVGGSSPHADTWRLTFQKKGSALDLVVNAANMPELMAGADLVIAAAGTTLLELAFMGLPGLVLVLAENQVRGAAAFQECGAVVNMGRNHKPRDLRAQIEHLLGAADQRKSMSDVGRRLVDGRGAERVVDTIRKG